MKRLLSLALSSSLLLAACGSDQPPAALPDEEVVGVVATTPVLVDMAKNVGSGLADVEELVPAGADPHDFEPTPADFEKLRQAKVIVRNGVGLEEWFDDMIKSSGTTATVVDASTGVTLRRTDAGADPHIWHSPVNAKIMVSNISKALQAADPAKAAAYQANERAYGAQIDGMSRDVQRLIDGLNDKRLVTNHDALGYYADQYGLELVTSIIPTFDSQAEVSPAQVQQLITDIRESGVKAVFVEAGTNADIANTIAEGAGVEVVSGEDSIFGDTLSEVGGPAATYIQMQRHNTDVIVKALR